MWVLGAFKLDHLQPFKPILYHGLSNMQHDAACPPNNETHCTRKINVIIDEMRNFISSYILCGSKLTL